MAAESELWLGYCRTFGVAVDLLKLRAVNIDPTVSAHGRYCGLRENPSRKRSTKIIPSRNKLLRVEVKIGVVLNFIFTESVAYDINVDCRRCPMYTNI